MAHCLYPLVSALKEPGKFDLVYHNENGTEVVEYAVTQEKRVSRLLLTLPTDSRAGGGGWSLGTKADIAASRTAGVKILEDRGSGNI